MALDPNAELSLLETAYQNFLSSGIAEYTAPGGRSVRYIDFKTLVQRMDELRAIIYRMNNGMFQAAQNRKPE